VSLPLTGRRVLVTRAAHQAGRLSDALRELGAAPVEVPVLEIQPPESYEALDEALTLINSYDWLLFTSVNAVVVFHVRAKDLGVPLSDLRARIAAVGRSTAEALEKLVHLKVSLTPREYVAERLVEALLKSNDALKGHDFSRAGEVPKKQGALAPEGSLAGERILIARAAVARDVIPDALRAAGATVDVVDAYRNVMPEAAPELLRAALEKGIAAATFTSSSSVTHLAEAANAAGITFPFAGVAAISIGPVTSGTLRENGWEPAAEASPSDIPGLVRALAGYFESV
jgi:uroporphyrinogen-III synthase